MVYLATEEEIVAELWTIDAEKDIKKISDKLMWCKFMKFGSAIALANPVQLLNEDTKCIAIVLVRNYETPEFNDAHLLVAKNVTLEIIEE